MSSPTRYDVVTWTWLARPRAVDGRHAPHRARRTTLDTSTGEARGAKLTVAVTSSPDEVITLLRTWLAAFLDPGADMGAVPS
jgi:hypothetical protein